ncbi:MAG: DNA primase [Paramuribaculum sp.]|nr:DNA primase [Paramuribaculum sp.]
MQRIDRETVQRILDAADIVEVVSDFVHLKRRGANYIGLCPFHNERTPSFSVSKSKGICKCFSCGKGGSPINFLMELEQLSYYEALKYLAKKYNIEIKERELSEAERQAENDRESMLAVNDFAMQHFEHNLRDTDDGRNIALAYLRERGLSQAMIDRFHLGYSAEKRDDLYSTAISKGFTEKYLVDTGLCYRTDRGTVTDRFRGRVIFPVLSVSGKVVAFGGRTMRTSKDVAKYVNSPESIIYSKSRELYGLYQAKQSIVRNDRCILVEGYMDVISMHQSGVENVVASSGTSLTEGQIRLIHRFTENVTVIYDSDAAGIKASLRGIDLLLAEGLNVRVVLFPEGEDPDSYARSHSSAELEQYLADNEQDFISFKTDILLQGTSSDPIQKAKAIQSIVRSISVIPDQITRNVYLSECARKLSISEKVLVLQVQKNIAENLEKQANDQKRHQGEADIADLVDTTPDTPTTATPATAPRPEADGVAFRMEYLRPYEEELLRYIVKYGLAYLCDYADASGNITSRINVTQYILEELADDEITIANPDYRLLFDAAVAMASADHSQRVDAERTRLRGIIDTRLADDLAMLRAEATDIAAAERRESELRQQAEQELDTRLDDYQAGYLGHTLMSDPDATIRRLSTDFLTTRHQLSKVHTKYSPLPTERDRLPELVPLAVYNLKNAIVELRIRQLKEKIQQAWENGDHEAYKEYFVNLQQLNQLKRELCKYLGERILTRPQRR